MKTAQNCLQTFAAAVLPDTQAVPARTLALARKALIVLLCGAEQPRFLADACWRIASPPSRQLQARIRNTPPTKTPWLCALTRDVSRSSDATLDEALTLLRSSLRQYAPHLGTMRFYELFQPRAKLHAFYESQRVPPLLRQRLAS
jgi:hypothetical protein